MVVSRTHANPAYVDRRIDPADRDVEARMDVVVPWIEERLA